MRLEDFYTETLRALLDRGLMKRESEVLVVCGGDRDREVFRALGFERVTISNLDVRIKGDEFAPYRWSRQDAENLTVADGSFDWVVVHSGLHHCYSPHRALLEMHRVARRGVLVFEPRDSFLVRLGIRFSFGQEYEVAAVVGNDLKFGGVGNTAIPNYVYRWTEREVEKTVNCGAPLGRSRVHYFYALRVPEARLKGMKNRVAASTLRILLPLLRIFTAIFPRQCNNFAFAVEKLQLPGDLHPWLAWEGGAPVLNRAWVEAHYDQKRLTQAAQEE
ncbi:MAG: class I SAM-dependent methyltransferase [Bryobacter sp.]|nr:class I SAM-dependent methyltransferase [Bryobacter sp.]